MVVTILTRGRSRGLGLALAAEFSKAGHLVFATARDDPTPAFEELIKSSSSTFKYIKLDATSRSSVQEAEKQVAALLDSKGIHVLINNAGVINWMTTGIHALDDLDSVLNSNVTSAHIVTGTFLPLLKRGAQKKVINMSSSGGSIERSSVYSTMAIPAYNVSKAALNMLTVQYAQSYTDEVFTFLAVNPGWLRIDLGGASADLDVETGAKADVELIE
ncbi:putative aflatoxin biosynthesis ketoreductase nor-1 protein [Botrytis fragariae]|uniref:Putative aflatoxin biosynthesis ketoreductase nor-1 protein n=1 Tax=Botrytis fragariae TaxID=1964551 RepID=A0A8H6EP99_9HELO|nr:putative aflatoxin biosynthesis ketoreductase nor-1 protein [Botrytis fragariae]KAF5879528.1 putative aflatoxin biosynthesis ketoreductase nor-1 protein [Botrytis fragariae]